MKHDLICWRFHANEAAQSRSHAAPRRVATAAVRPLGRAFSTEKNIPIVNDIDSR
jgi:hypothetical protein